MKTNVVMIRKMGTFEVSQRIEDGFFEANILLSQWNVKEQIKRRRISEFLESTKTKEFIETLIESQSEKIDNGVNQVFTIKKGKNTAKGKEKDEVWMHPYLFIDFAMWINPKFKVQVLKFVYDELIKNRHTAGDNYKMLSSAGIKLQGYNFKEVATALNWIVFNKNAKDLRQSATQEQLQEISEIESKLAYSIDMGYIKSYDHLIKEMRKLWNKKYAKF